MDADDRTFMHDLLLRHERATDAMIARSADLSRRLDEKTDAVVRRLDEGTEALKQHTAEFVAESRAQRAALFRRLDRRDGGAEAGT